MAEIITYGGGEALEKTFNGIAMLFNGGQTGMTGFIQPVLVICAFLGAIYAVCRALKANSVTALLQQYLLPLVLVMTLLHAPTTTVHIADRLESPRVRSVGNVPYVVGVVVPAISTFFHKITQGVEAVMHTPGDNGAAKVRYSETGMVFGSEVSFDIGQMTIADGDLRTNLGRFCKQCVLYDLALGQYSIDELKQTNDLWGFLEQRTSKARMVPYIHKEDSQAKIDKGSPAKGDQVNHDKMSTKYLTCRQAITAMRPLFKDQTNYWSKQELVKRLPLTYQALTGLQKNTEDLVGQQMMMELLRGEFSGDRFAAARVHAQERNTYQTVGHTAGQALVVMRVVFEALLYFSIILIIPLCLLPGGLKIAQNWLKMLIWIQLWPIFYTFINYLMQVHAHSASANLLLGADGGTSLYTSYGLKMLYQDIHAKAGYLALSVPFLSYMIIWGGVQSFVHMAGAMMTPLHTAASAAAAEQTAGSYSYANSSMGQFSYGNVSTLQRNFSPSLSSGSMTENLGTHSMTYTGSETILKQAKSELRQSVFGDRSVSQTAVDAHHHANTLSEQSQKHYQKSLSSHGRTVADFTEHAAQSTNYAHSTNTREGVDIQESARRLSNTAASWGEQHGLNKHQSLEMLGAIAGHAGGGINLGAIKFGADLETKLSMGKGQSRSDVLNSAINFARSEDFQTSYQSVISGASSEAFNSSNDDGSRLSTSITRSVDQVEQAHRSRLVAKQTAETFSKAINSSDHQSVQVREHLDQELVNWAGDAYADQGGISFVADVLAGDDHAQRTNMVYGFLEHIGSQHDRILNQGLDSTVFSHGHSISDLASARANEWYDQKQVNSVDLDRADADARRIEQKALDHGVTQGASTEQGVQLVDTVDALGSQVATESNLISSGIDTQDARLSNQFNNASVSDDQASGASGASQWVQVLGKGLGSNWAHRIASTLQVTDRPPGDGSLDQLPPHVAGGDDDFDE